jgi:hypothetical protein
LPQPLHAQSYRQTAPFYEELFSLIDVRCKHWVFLSNNQRMDIGIFWRGIRDDGWKTEA